MGLPDLPENNDNPNSVYLSEGNVQIFNHENDNELRENNYSGYEPLGNLENGIDNNLVDSDDDDSDNDTVVECDNEPKIISPELELEAEVWNAPRPVELNIELDSTKTEQILSAMASISLPTAAIPEWAQGIPEEKWKEDLLEKIREKRNEMKK